MAILNLGIGSNQVTINIHGLSLSLSRVQVWAAHVRASTLKMACHRTRLLFITMREATGLIGGVLVGVEHVAPALAIGVLLAHVGALLGRSALHGKHLRSNEFLR